MWGGIGREGDKQGASRHDTARQGQRLDARDTCVECCVASDKGSPTTAHWSNSEHACHRACHELWSRLTAAADAARGGQAAGVGRLRGGWGWGRMVGVQQQGQASLGLLWRHTGVGVPIHLTDKGWKRHDQPRRQAPAWFHASTWVDAMARRRLVGTRVSAIRSCSHTRSTKRARARLCLCGTDPTNPNLPPRYSRRSATC